LLVRQEPLLRVLHAHGALRPLLRELTLLCDVVRPKPAP
jgi:hypothetical protein